MPVQNFWARPVDLKLYRARHPWFFVWVFLALWPPRFLRWKWWKKEPSTFSRKFGINGWNWSLLGNTFMWPEGSNTVSGGNCKSLQNDFPGGSKTLQSGEQVCTMKMISDQTRLEAKHGFAQKQTSGVVQWTRTMTVVIWLCGCLDVGLKIFEIFWI